MIYDSNSDMIPSLTGPTNRGLWKWMRTHVRSHVPVSPMTSNPFLKFWSLRPDDDCFLIKFQLTIYGNLPTANQSSKVTVSINECTTDSTIND